MNEPLCIAVLGTGYVGSAFARAAAAANHRVWAVRRSPVPTSASAVTWLRGDIASAVINGLPDRLDVVVLTVAPASGDDGYNAVYVPAATGAVALAKKAGARSLFYTSSTGVYGGRDGAWVTEQSERRGAGASNAALIAAEDIVLSGGVAATTVLRVAGIYGPGRDPRTRMALATQLPQRGEYWVNLAHRDDIVAALMHVTALANAPPVLNVSDGSPERANAVARWLAAAIGNDPDALIFGNEFQRSRNDQRVSNAALRSTGWSPVFPDFRQGFTAGL